MKARRIAIALAAFAACSEPPFPREGVTLGGRHVSYAVLRAGRNAYGMYCIGCHGVDGDGKGPVGLGLRPRPRDLRLGTIRYAWVASGRLPRDEDLARAVRHGLRGTPMPSWDLTDEELGDLIQYVKLFSPRWRDETAGEAIVPSPDPWLGRESDARAEGERVYHGRALCWACHPAYEPATAIARDEEAMQGHAAATPRPDLGRAVATVLEDGTRKLPTDFAVDPLQAGDATIDVYRDIACGLGGASMPAYRNALSERDLWALAHYVHALATARETLTAGTASE